MIHGVGIVIKARRQIAKRLVREREDGVCAQHAEGGAVREGELNGPGPYRDPADFFHGPVSSPDDARAAFGRVIAGDVFGKVALTFA